jgi:glycosyltransferase involved in cell wall biosynthesis
MFMVLTNNQAEKFTLLPDAGLGPMWSVMIPTYNCAGYLRETLESVLQQDPGVAYMQIEVVDDCSSKDDPEQVVKEVGKGRVSFYRQPQNVGHVRNFNTCIKRASGKLVHILHGDDRVRPGFYLKMETLFRQYPLMGAAYCRFITMFEDGQWESVSKIEEAISGLLSNSLIRLAENQIVQPPAMVVRREVYEQLGGYDQRLKYGEDWEMWVRIAANYPVGYETEPLAEYREHTNSLSSILIRTAEDTSNIHKAITLSSINLKVANKQKILDRARAISASNALKKAIKVYKAHRSLHSVLIQSWEALKMQPKITFLLYMIKVHVGAFIRSFRSKYLAK